MPEHVCRNLSLSINFATPKSISLTLSKSFREANVVGLEVSVITFLAMNILEGRENGNRCVKALPPVQSLSSFLGLEDGVE